MNLKSSLLFFLTAILLVSCDKKRVFDEYKSVGKSWNKDSIVSFELPKIDTTKQYNAYLNIRNNDNYAFNNLFGLHDRWNQFLLDVDALGMNKIYALRKFLVFLQDIDACMHHDSADPAFEGAFVSVLM